jgi:hypothetical protein
MEQPSPAAPPADPPEAEKTQKALTPGQVAGIAAAAVVVLAGGAGAGFFAVNAADYKEVVRLAVLAAAPADAVSGAGVSAAGKLKYPFMYLRLRKYSRVLGLKDEDGFGKLLKKMRLPWKSGSKALMDLSGALNAGNYTGYRIRHPKKAMNGKKDVTIAYMDGGAIIAQDHFDSREDFVNVKYLELGDPVARP